MQETGHYFVKSMAKYLLANLTKQQVLPGLINVNISTNNILVYENHCMQYLKSRRPVYDSYY